MNDDIEVSIICVAYNHEKYIARCLDGFVNQKTDFRFEILVHDDASTDSTLGIIMEYEKQFPDMITVVTEQENLYSQGVYIPREVLLPMAQGKYIAFCEGDDYWIDPYKLQKQYDFMQEHPDCSLCCHNTIVHDLSGASPDVVMNQWSEVHLMTEEEVFLGWYVHTTSYFIRADVVVMPEKKEYYEFTDYIMLCFAYDIGDVYVLPDIMSVYNGNNPQGLTVITRSDNDRMLKSLDDRVRFLEEYDAGTEGRHHEIVKYRIEKQMVYKLNAVKSLLGEN